MIRMTAQDRLRTVQLLREHRAGQHVWPGETAKGKRGVGTVDHGGIQPLRPADQEADRPGKTQPFFQERGQCEAVGGRAILVQDNRDGIARQRGEQRGPFPPLHFGGRAGRFGKLGQFQPGAYTGGVAGEQLGLRPRAHPANGDDADHQPDLGHTPR